MTRIYVCFNLTPDGERALAFGADLAAGLQVPLAVCIDADDEAEILFHDCVETKPHVMEERAVQHHVCNVLARGAVNVRPEFYRAQPSEMVLEPDAILIGACNVSALSTASFIAPMKESALRSRGDGPICIPWGKGDSCRRVAEIALPLAAKLGLSVVFYHTTWIDPQLPADALPERHMLQEVAENLRMLRGEADHLGLRHEAVIETADDVVEGLIRFALRWRSSLIAMAPSERIGIGSHVTQVLERSVTPVLVVGRSRS